MRFPRHVQDRRLRGAWLGAVLGVLAILGGVVLTAGSGCGGRCAAPGSDPRPAVAAPSPTEPATIAVVPGPDARDVHPDGPVVVSAASGTVQRVVMTNDSGKEIPGVLAPDGHTWKPAVDELGYGRTYTLTISGRGPGGMLTKQTAAFTTVDPERQTSVSLETVAGSRIADGATYGVGTVVVARFDEQIPDRAAAERHLKVTTTPRVTGSWYWTDDRTAHWRPEKYYQPGTTVTVRADIYGDALGGGLYGQQDEQVSFRIGDAHVSVADDLTKQVSVFDNGKLVRTMPTSMGMGGTETIGNATLSFWTPRGVYTVMDKANPVIMDSSTFGLPISSRLGYRETIPWATRISTDGIYLHQLNATVWAQGNTNTSHGCLNLNSENARWFFDFSVPGDVVEVRNTGGAPLTLAQNGDWSVPWGTWRQGSALR